MEKLTRAGRKRSYFEYLLTIALYQLVIALVRVDDQELDVISVPALN